MEMYDTVIVNCPKCGAVHEFQSKSGECNLETYTLKNCPDDVIENVNRHSPSDCLCGISIKINIPKRKAVGVVKPMHCEICNKRVLKTKNFKSFEAYDKFDVYLCPKHRHLGFRHSGKESYYTHIEKYMIPMEVEEFKRIYK
jgi:phage FluMu protein Com